MSPGIGTYGAARALAYGLALIALVCGGLYHASGIVVGGRLSAGYLLALASIVFWIVGMLELGHV